MKTGYKTTEFWMSLAAVIIGGLMASGLFSDDSFMAKAIGLIAGALASLGYTVSRTWAKVGEMKSEALKVAATAPLPPAS